MRFLTPAELRSIRVGGTTRRGLAFAMHPNRQRENAGNVLDDVAIIQLDRPVTDATPATLGGPSVGPSPSPVRAPAHGGPATITETPRVGETLTCSVASWTNDPTGLQVLWQSQSGGRPRNVSRRATSTVRESDRGRRLACVMSASNAGGPSAAPLSQASIVRIPR